MSTTATTYTAISAFVAGENAFLGKDRIWQPYKGNPLQTKFINEYLRERRAELGKIPEIETIAALSEVPINEFLAKRGFTIRLDKFPKLAPPERAWGAAAVLDLTLEWLHKGRQQPGLPSRAERFPAVSMSDGVEFRSVRGHGMPIARIATKGGDTVHMTILDEPLERFELIEKAKMISTDTADYEYGFGGVMFPMVSLDHEVDISWMLGMWTTDDENYDNHITQAKQQTKFKMNHLGARVKDAVAIGAIRATGFRPTRVLMIDQPFLLSITRPGLSDPIFSAYLTESEWRDPGSLSDM